MNKIYLILICLLAFGCKNKSNPGMKLTQLEDQLQTESSSVEKKEETKISFKPDSTLKHFHLKEQRNNDKEHVVKIDLTQNTSTKDFILSDLGTTIEYIKLHHPDSLYFITGETNVLVSDNYIITHNLRGVCLFRPNGDFINYIVKNDVEIFISSRGNVGYGMFDFKGVMAIPHISNNQLLYVYSNVPEKYRVLYSIDLNQQFNANDSLENQGVIIKKYQGGFDKGISSFVKLNQKTLLGFNSLWNSVQTNELFYSFNEFGDTLCTFKNYDPIGEFKYRNYQMAEARNLYSLDDGIRYRQAYNDTIYLIHSENVMEPKYILYRGSKGLTTQEGITPMSDLTGKILFNQIYENAKWLIVVTSNNHSSPNNKEAGKVKFEYWFYNKITKVLASRNGNYSDENVQLKNTIDNGLDFWPTDVTKSGYFISAKPVKYLIEDYSEQKLRSFTPFDNFSTNELLITILK